MRIIPRITITIIVAALCFIIACKKGTSNVPVPAAVLDATTQAPANTQATATPVVSTPKTLPTNFKTQNVIIIVVDGPRYSETWGDASHQFIPERFALSSEAVVLTNFMNMGTTLTDPGHDAICTGNYEALDNFGGELPQYPSIFQNWLKSTGKPAEKAWVVTSKDKLAVLANCKQTEWADKYIPRTDCGKNGIYSGYRADDTTFVHASNILKTYHPNLMLINFKDPDSFGHSNLWNSYLKAIQSTDAYVKKIYDLIQNDENYKDKTTLIVTNDHGRHLDSVADGFINHGDDCYGCRHIEFFAIGPDFKKGALLASNYEQIDISKTVSKLLNFNMEYTKGKIMTDLFK